MTRWTCVAAKRSEQIGSELALPDYETNRDADEIVHAVQGLSRATAARVVAVPGTSGKAS